MSNKTICLVHIDKIVNRIGGAEKVLVDMANAFVHRGFTVHILCYDNENGLPFYRLDPKVNFHLCIDKWQHQREFLRKLYCLPLPSLARRQKRFTLKMERIAQLFNATLNKIKPDLIIAYSPDLIFLLNRILHVEQPVICMLHNDPRFFISHKNFQFYRSYFYKKDVVQVLVPDFIPIIQKELPRIKITSIPNYIHISQNQKLTNYESKSIINTSRISQQKRHDLLIDAFALVANKFPDWRLDLWGPMSIDASYTHKLLSKIKKDGLSDRILFHGETNDVHSKLIHSSIFLFPSEFEGFSLALLEALSHGLPVIACEDCLSVSSILTDNVNAFLTAPRPDQLAIALEKLMSNTPLREAMGHNAFSLAQEFDECIIWDKWENLVSQLCS